jgi:hypothetical protein
MEKIATLADSSAEKQRIADITAWYHTYVALYEKESTLLTQSTPPPRKEYLEEIDALLGRVDEGLRSLIQNVRLKRDEQVDLSGRISHRTIRVTIVTAALTIGLGILISFYITRSIGKPSPF